MRKFICLIGIISLLQACREHTDLIIPVVTKPTIAGGNGGKFNIALFTLSGSNGVSGKVYIKYACKSIPHQATTYNDSSATMVEPGYGPHAHFINLKEGFYLLSAKGNFNAQKVSGDTIIEITATQKAATDYNIHLK